MDRIHLEIIVLFPSCYPLAMKDEILRDPNLRITYKYQHIYKNFTPQ